MPEIGGSSPESRFAGGAAASLAPVARELDTVGERVGAGELRLDPELARRLLDELSAVRARVEELLSASSDGIDRPLRFGDNIVAKAMGERFRGAASGPTGAAIPVLRGFLAQVEKVENIVARAARLVTDADEDAAERLGRAGEGGSP